MIKIIASNGSSYLIDYGDGSASIADQEQNKIFPRQDIGSILKHGYWEKFEHSDKLLADFELCFQVHEWNAHFLCLSGKIIKK